MTEYTMTIEYIDGTTISHTFTQTQLNTVLRCIEQEQPVCLREQENYLFIGTTHLKQCHITLLQ